MAIADTITSMQNHTSNAYTMIGYGTDLTGINKNLENLSTSIFNAFLESLRTPDTLFTNLPKKSASGSNISLTGVANAPMRITLSPSELTQASTPTPSSPQEVHTISGDNTINVYGKNLFNLPDKAQETSPKGLTFKVSNNVFTITGTNTSTTAYALVSWYDTNTQNYYNNFFRKGDMYTLSINNAISGLYLQINYYKEGSSTQSSMQNYTLTTEKVSFTIPQDFEKIGNIFIGVFGTATSVNGSFSFQLEKGNTKTEFTAYEPVKDNPVNLGVENLYDFRNYKLTSQSIMSRTELADGSYLFTATGSGYAFAQYNLSLPAGTYSYKIETDTSSNYVVLNGQSATSNPFTINETTAITFRVFISNAVSGNKVILKNIILEKGSKIQEPSENPIEYCKIGTYEDKFIRTSGKNLQSGLESGGIDNSGNEYASSSAIRSKYYVKVQPNTTYTCSLNGTSTNVNIAQYTGSKTFISLTFYAGTFTTSSTTEYIRITKNGSTTDLIQVEKGSTATSYEPYGSNEWYIKKNIGKVVLDGTEDWTENSGWNTSNPNTFHVRTTALPYTNRVYTDFLCNNFKTQLGRQGLLDGNLTYWESATNSTWYVFIDASKLSEVSEAGFKSWLSNNNMIVYYVLATPTYTQITGTLETQLENVYQKLLSYTGQTNISQINNDLSFNMVVSAIEK